MTRKKRLRKEKRRANRPQQFREPAVLEVSIPSPGPRTFGAGWGVSWRGLISQFRRPWSLLPVTLGTMVVFSLIQMALLYGANIALYGGAIPTDAQAQYINTGLWQIFAYLLGPASITPWFAARTLFASRLPVSWKLVKEPFGAPWRWAHLLGLGVVWMVVAGVAGAGLSQLHGSVNVWAIMGLVALLWLLTQVVFSVAAASVWRDGEPWYLALWVGFSHPIRGVVPLAGMVVAWVVQIIVLGGLVFITFGLPLTVIELSFNQFRLASLLVLPIALIVISFLYHQRAILGLAALDWGRPGWRPEKNP